MTRMLSIATVVCAVFAAPIASATTITFDELAFPGAGEGAINSFTSLTVGEYIFTALQAGRPLLVQAQDNPNNADPGGATLGIRTAGSDLGFTMARVDGALFDLTSADVTHFNNGMSDSGNGGTLDFFFTGAPAFRGSYDINPGFKTYALGVTGISSVRVTSNNYFQIDNLLVSGGAVPEPSSWLLMLAGFATMGGVMRTARLKTTGLVSLG